MIVITCCKCGITFGMTAEFYELANRDGRSFWCPSGHRQHFVDSTDDELKREKKETEALRQCLADANKKIEVAKKQIATLKRKAKGGKR